ncbi:MAG: protease modulator HflC [Gammaproteobacteria bacterium]
MSGRANLIVIVAGLLALVIGVSVFTVDEREYAIKFRFGEIIKSDYEPGIHFKIPFVNNVLKLDRRILTRTNPTEEFLTVKKKNLYVDFFIKWRIEDPAKYYIATSGNEEAAARRLLEVIKDGIRAEFAKRTVQEVVSAERTEIMADMLENARNTASDFGIRLVDVRVKRIDFPDKVSDSVFARMRQERHRVAAQLRAEGHENSERIRADADRQRTVILANAYRDAEITRGRGDAKSAEVYAKAYSKNAEFYSFFRRMQAYRRSLGKENDILLIKPEGDFFKYLSNKQGNSNP